MKRKYLFVILSLIFAIFLSGCGGVITPSTNLTGNWTITITTTSGTPPSYFDGGEVKTATCSIVDNDGSLTISDFTIIGQEYINWEVSYGTFSKPTFTTGYLNGSYNDDGSTVTLVIIFEGDINEDGTSGTATWTATVNVSGGNGGNGSGTSIFIKE
jgi:hypothetical protein